MTGWITGRTIIEESGVAAKRDTVTEDYPRFESMWIGITWLIARVGDKLGATKTINDIEYRLHVFSPRSDDFPEVTLLYKIDKDTVTICDIGIQIGAETAKSATITKIH